MSNFFQNLPYKLANFMVGRNGPDALARATLWMGVLFTFLEIITGLGICSLIGMVFLLYFMFRCFSRNIGLFGGFCGRDSGIGPAQRAKTTIWN